MSKVELPKSFESKLYEDQLYERWLASGLFNPDICIEKGYTEPNSTPYSIVLPPPNVTGTLHMGHATMLAIQDVLIRYHRMKGDRTLWVPGTDHASIATESKVEKLLIEKGMKKPKEELGREAFLKEVEDFAQKSHDTIVNQAKKMGASLDWSREAYTLDDARNLAVRTMFKQMYDDGLIYRGYRVVNWSVKGQSTCSDDELVMVERAAKLYTFTYGPECPIAIATTRPETKLGDTAIAVHPEGRWKQYIGQTFTISDFGQSGHTLTLKVIGDDGVEDDFGTGALGVTPAHSAVDFEMYSKQKAAGNDIGLIAVIGEDGKMTNAAGAAYAGLPVVDAKEKIVDWLRASGRLQKEEDITQNVGTSDRFSDVVEPLPKTQWFIDVNKKVSGKGLFVGRQVSLKEMMQEVVRDGKTRIVPERFEKTYFHWIDNLRDWCISRQIWFGHRIPAYLNIEDEQNHAILAIYDENNFSKEQYQEFVKIGNLLGADLVKKSEMQVVNAREYGFAASGNMSGHISVSFKILQIALEKNLISEEELHKFKFLHNNFVEQNIIVSVDNLGSKYLQDPDTLDTWFSSGLWTFSTLGWPNITTHDTHNTTQNDFAVYHPTSVLETGYDILFFWVARMILMSTYAIGDVPFKDVYLHGLVRDEQGRKMSKTLGNIIDPLDMIEQYGTDATRLSLLIGSSAGNDVKLSEEKISGFRNFTNKLWNISRFMIGKIQETNSKIQIDIERPVGNTLADKWILSRLDTVISQATTGLDSYQFSPVGEMLRDFTWNDLADWYLEIAKVEGGKSEVLNYILNTILKLWHPYMPFVTEQIWQEVYGEESVLMVAAWPAVSVETRHASSLQQDNDQFVVIQNVITAIRSVRAQQQIEPAKKINVTIVTGVETRRASSLQDNAPIIAALARLGSLSVVETGEKPSGAVAFVESGVEIFVDVSGAIDTEKEKIRIAKELAEVEPYIKQLEAKLAGDFATNAPAPIVEKERQKLADAKAKLEKLRASGV